MNYHSQSMLNRLANIDSRCALFAELALVSQEQMFRSVGHLVQYMRHLDDCSWPETKCTCGLSESIRNTFLGEEDDRPVECTCGLNETKEKVGIA